MLFVVGLYASFFVISNCQVLFRDVRTDQGPVRGFTVDDDEVVSFYGIPYATAPRGEDRFKGPLPPQTWTETFNATSKDIICPQGADSTGGEDAIPQTTYDCLVVNVFIPDTHEDNIPVYVDIHGGAYQYGHSTKRSFIDMVKRGMIVVTLNYRVGLHGLLCLGTEFAPGNAGMKDQVAALRWIKRNIESFGGNPDMITVGGSSAGSGSTELQLLSPMSNGLFTKVIPASASALGWDVVTLFPLLTAERFANSRGVYTDQNVEELENYYRSLTDDDMNLSYPSDHRNTGFLPCIETHNLTGVEKFLSERPLAIIKEGRFEQRPILTGFTPMEGLLYIYRFDEDAPLMATNFTDFLPNDIEFESTEHVNEIADKVKHLYFPTGEITAAGYIDYYTDIIFAYPQYLSARSYAELQSMPVYLYVFTYNGTLNLPSVYLSPILGPGHVAQSLYVYDADESLGSRSMNSYDYLVQDRVRTMWYNFIVSGEPIPSRTELLEVDWNPLDNELDNFMEINLELKIGQHPLPERFALWDEIYGHFQKNV